MIRRVMSRDCRVVGDADAARTPSLLECIRQEIDCVCGVHGYAVYHEFDYFCDECGNSDHAEFHGNPKNSKVDKESTRRIKPEAVSESTSRRGRKKTDFMSGFFKRSYRPKSAP